VDVSIFIYLRSRFADSGLELEAWTLHCSFINSFIKDANTKGSRDLQRLCCFLVDSLKSAFSVFFDGRRIT
jgi:hypothetical protein